MEMEIRYLDSALEDLDNITDYYFLKFGYNSAEKVRNQITNAISNLRDWPDAGVPAKHRDLKKQGYKEIYPGRYVVIYKAEAIEGKIYIYHIADTKMDYPHFYRK